jgi:hypothetical protein
MVMDDNIEQQEVQQYEVRQVPRENVKFPPQEGDNEGGENGRMYSVCCSDPECGFWGDLTTDYRVFDPSGECPDCGKPLQVDFQRMSWGVDSRGPGFHSTKIGDRIKRDRIKRNEKLAQTQWENHSAGNVVNPERVLNPTKGGPFDPNSKFNKHKQKNTKVIYPGGRGS